MATAKKAAPKKAVKKIVKATEKKIVKKELTLAEVKVISEILEQTRKIAAENREIVSYIEGRDSIFQFTDIDKESTFSFTAFYTHLQGRNKKVSFLVEYEPKDIYDISICDCDTDMEGVLKRLHSWVAILADYARYHLTEEDKIRSQAEKEFYEMFDFVDIDAETNAFDLKQQLFLDNGLANVEQVLESRKDESEVADIIEEVKKLRSSIPMETKKTIGKRLSKIFAAVKKYSLTLFKEVFKDFLKDAGKWGIEGAYHRMIEYFQ